MQIKVDKEWCIEAARREGDSEVGAGLLACDPEPPGLRDRLLWFFHRLFTFKDDSERQ